MISSQNNLRELTMSNYFDPTLKENKPILDYFESKKWLIIESSLSTRSSIKKSLTQIGPKQANMLDCDNLKSALEIIRLEKPHYILTNKYFAGGGVIDIFFEHLKHNTNRLQSGFYVITEENSLSEVAQALNYEMDGLISFPFTASSIISSIVAGAKLKIAPSNYQLKVNTGKQQYLEDNLDFAESFFQEAVALHNFPFEALFYLGEINYKKEKFEIAIEYLEKATTTNENHYRTLFLLCKLYYKLGEYEKAYEISINLVRKFPTPSDFIPDLVRLSIINKKYGDIVNYYKLFSKITNPNAGTQRSISAGLVILGIYFSNNNELEKSRDALLKALSFSSGKIEIIESITNTFNKIGMLPDLIAEFEKIDFSLWPEASEGFYFHALHLTSNDDQQVLNFGEKLLRKGVKNIIIDKGVIERGIAAGRKYRVIEVQVLDAIRKFPHEANLFENYLKVAKRDLA